jgi:ABC-2 type transport system ATP-binding protein
MKSLLNRLDKEVFVLDLKYPLMDNLELNGLIYQQVDETTIEVEINRGESLNSIFELLSRHGLEVVSMKNKANRLEELFLNLVEASEQVS